MIFNPDRMKLNFLILLFFIVCLNFSSYGQVPSHVFHQLSVKDGLCEGTVRAIVEDSRGFMWFGTEDGLNKYDGYKFSVYKNDSDNKFSVSSNNIKCLLSDSKGNLWIGTRHGLNLYDPIQDKFFNYTSPGYEALKYTNGDIEAITEDKSGVLWLVSETFGLLKINSLNEVPEKYNYQSNDSYGSFCSVEVEKDGNLLLGSTDGLFRFNTKFKTFEDLRNKYGNDFQVRDIYYDKNDNLWLATTKGLKCVSKNTGTVKSYYHKLGDEKSLNGNNTNRFLPENNTFLIAIDGSGVDLMDPDMETFHHYSKESGTQLSSNNITAIYRDTKGTLWLGTYLNGINFSNSTTNFFVLVKNNSTSSRNIKAGIVTCFLTDSRGNLWVGTDGSGLHFKKNGSNDFINYNSETANPVVHSNAIIALDEDKDGCIWVSTYAGGLTRIYPTGKHETFRYDPQNTNSLCWDKLKDVNEHNGKVWVSSNGMGICAYDIKTNNFKRYRANPDMEGSLPTEWVSEFFIDHKGVMWLATFEGLCRYNPDNDNFTTYRFKQGHDKNYVFDIMEDSDKNLWLGSMGGGLLLFDRKKEAFIAFTTIDGLSDNVVKSVIEDNAGNLWLATNNGITKFNLKTRKPTAYTINDGLPPSSFFYDSKFKDENGKIYFGTNEGYLIINPDLSDERTDHPEVALTELRIFNNPVQPLAENTYLDRHITEAKEIIIPYYENSLSFEFAGLNFSIPRQNYYAYTLEGFDEGWNYSGKSRIAKYTNINPGTYIFKVKASNNEKIWGDKYTSFKVTINPPFWKTWWFMTFLVLSSMGVVIGFFYLRTQAIRQRNKWLSDEVNERTKELVSVNRLLEEEKDNVVKQSDKILEQQKELLERKYELEKNNNQLAEWNEFQNKLIGILGHDIRGPLQQFSLLLKYKDEESSEWVNAKLKETADGLSLLATDLLGWINLQSKKGEVELSEFGWDVIINKAQKQLETSKTDKQIVFAIKNDEKNLVKGVPPIVLSCMRNILSNAIRFSKTGGLIEIETGARKGEYSCLRITDYGDGFDAAQVNKLIQGEAFKGMRDSSLKEGAGLGMAICYDMLKRSGGWMEAVSLPSSGATFFVYLPVASDKVVLQNEPEKKESLVSDLLKIKLDILKGRTILLVDDDDDLRWNIARLLNGYAEIQEVRSVEEALSWLKYNTPDMALLDIRLQGASGLDLCYKLKNTKETAHVPCTIISGEVGDEIRKRAFEVGADGFISKPFQSEELLIHIANYFENQHKKLKRFFQENSSVNQLTENPLNQEFLVLLVQNVEDNLMMDKLSVDYLSKACGLSRSSLYRKLKSLTGQSVNDFIISIRMRKALTLLKEKDLTIADVAVKTGFNSPSYFTTSFKKHFGYNPTDLK